MIVLGVDDNDDKVGMPALLATSHEDDWHCGLADLSYTFSGWIRQELLVCVRYRFPMAN